MAGQINGKEGRNMQAMVHAKTCIQCGLCPAVCPDVFTLDPGEPARAISGPVPEECRLAAQEAADSCPVGAIEIR
ncbi:MAG: ferredoxin [Oscillospiraceae bacterium]